MIFNIGGRPDIFGEGLRGLDRPYRVNVHNVLENDGRQNSRRRNFIPERKDKRNNINHFAQSDNVSCNSPPYRHYLLDENV